MGNKSRQELIALHEAFLECRPVDRPLVGLWIGGYYPAEQFPRGTAAVAPEQRLDPQDVRFALFADDYESLYQAHLAVDDDFFYVGSAYWGIPWLEAILGCPVSLAAANCRAEAFLSDPADFAGCDADLDADPWLAALLRFNEELVRFADGRFPVCPPLLRGPGDVASAMLGGTEFVTGFIDRPDAMKRLLDDVARTRVAVLGRLHAILPAWHETHAAGGYPSRVWCRRTVAYYQEDSAALLNPRLFREFLLPLAKRGLPVGRSELHPLALGVPVSVGNAVGRQLLRRAPDQHRPRRRGPAACGVDPRLAARAGGAAPAFALG